jgi:methylase of polypeptide subunit release factors
MTQPAIVPPSVSDAARLRNFLKDSGFTSENTLKTLKLDDLPAPSMGVSPELLEKLQDRTTLNLLLRWFYISSTLTEDEIDGAIPDWFVELACASKILRKEGKDLVPLVFLGHFMGHCIACDQNARFEANDPNFVLWPNATTQFLRNFMAHRPSRATLDLGTGNGCQALAAAAFSEKVVGTDLNARALEFAAFNARLNGIENVEWIYGDAFAPVSGRKFDVIVSNPPFFIGPANNFLFCDNPMELDQFCRHFAREGAKHLEEGGCLQMLCEWVEIKGQRWNQRLEEWFEGTGCDAWVVKGHTRSPDRYALDRLHELAVKRNVDMAVLQNYADYFRERNVSAVHNGMIAMRRRTGRNWLLMEEVGNVTNQPFGDLVLARFAAFDFLTANTTPSQILAIRPKLPPHVKMEQVLRRAGDQWETESVTLRLGRGVPCAFGLKGDVAAFVNQFDGKQTLGELVQQLSAQVSVPGEAVEKECIQLVRKLIENGMVFWE